MSGVLPNSWNLDTVDPERHCFFASEAHISCAGIILDHIHDSLSSHMKMLTKARVHDWCNLLQRCRTRLSTVFSSPSPENGNEKSLEPFCGEHILFCTDYVQEIFTREVRMKELDFELPIQCNFFFTLEIHWHLRLPAHCSQTMLCIIHSTFFFLRNTHFRFII